MARCAHRALCSSACAVSGRLLGHAHRRVAHAPPAHGRGFGFAGGCAGLDAAAPRRRRGAAVARGWGDDVSFAPATVSASAAADESATLTRIAIDGCDEAGYREPGQFVQVKVAEGDKPAFMAIASPPNAGGGIELLVRGGGGETAGKLCGLAPGAEVLLSGVMGKGFRTGERAPAAPDSVVFIFATGSGISPIRSLIESGGDEGFHAGARKRTVLFYGCRSRAHIPLAAEGGDAMWRAWRESFGVDSVVVALSDPAEEEGEAGGVRFARGYVQEVFRRDAGRYMEGVDVGADDVAVVMCGQREMCDEVTAIFTDLGVEKFLFNF